MQLIIDQLLKADIIECAVKHSPFLSYPFLIPKPNGDRRFIVDYAHLTPRMIVPPMRLPSFPRMITQQRFSRHDKAIVIDLKNAFFSLPVQPQSRFITQFMFRGPAL